MIIKDIVPGDIYVISGISAWFVIGKTSYTEPGDTIEMTILTVLKCWSRNSQDRKFLTTCDAGSAPVAGYVMVIRDGKIIKNYSHVSKEASGEVS